MPQPQRRSGSCVADCCSAVRCSSAAAGPARPIVASRSSTTSRSAAVDTEPAAQPRLVVVAFAAFAAAASHLHQACRRGWTARRRREGPGRLAVAWGLIRHKAASSLLPRYTGTDTQARIHRHGYTGADTQARIHRRGYTGHRHGDRGERSRALHSDRRGLSAAAVRFAAAAIRRNRPAPPHPAHPRRKGRALMPRIRRRRSRPGSTGGTGLRGTQAAQWLGAARCAPLAAMAACS